jgi:hypothetical protein
VGALRELLLEQTGIADATAGVVHAELLGGQYTSVLHLERIGAQLGRLLAVSVGLPGRELRRRCGAVR